MRFTESIPVTVSQVVGGSAAERAGLMVGDFVLELNGHDVAKTSVDGVRSLIKYVEGSVLTLNVGRPHPIPVTVMEEKKALLAVQTKVRLCVYLSLSGGVFVIPLMRKELLVVEH